MTTQKGTSPAELYTRARASESAVKLAREVNVNVKTIRRLLHQERMKFHQDRRKSG